MLPGAVIEHSVRPIHGTLVCIEVLQYVRLNYLDCHFNREASVVRNTFAYQPHGIHTDTTNNPKIHPEPRLASLNSLVIVGLSIAQLLL